MYLLDTNVISELRKTAAGRADGNVVAWIDSVSPISLYISVVSVLEIEQGILGMERRDAQQGGLLRQWFEERVLPAFSGRILPIDIDVALACAALHVPDPRSDRDALIAAAALVHGMAVVTRNIADFEALVDTVNPWDQGVMESAARYGLLRRRKQALNVAGFQ